DETAEGLLPGGVDAGPGGEVLGFPRGFFHVLRGALGAERPGAHQGLVEQILGVAIRYPLRTLHTVALVVAGPAADGLAPALRDLGEEVQTQTQVVAPLGVVGRDGGHRPRPALLRHGALAVEVR